MADPFEERHAPRYQKEMQVLGARVRFESESRELLRLVDAAYAGLPRHRLSNRTPWLTVRLILATRERGGSSPPALQMMSAGGLLAGATAPSCCVAISADEASALVVIPKAMLRSPYHVRYELIEFAVFTLAARVQGLVALHGACVGQADRGVLLVGPSGAGKSTVTLQCLSEGFRMLSEDSVFVTPDTLLATGVSNFLHLRADSLKWVSRTHQSSIRRSPTIRRRTGTRKYEVDLRRDGYALAMRPLQLSAVVFLSAKPAGGDALIIRLPRAKALSMLEREQLYAVNQPPWRQFRSSLRHIPFFELRRGTHPKESVAALRSLLD